MKPILCGLSVAVLAGCSTLLKPTVTEHPVLIAGHTNIVVVTNTVAGPTVTLPPIVVTNTVVTPPRVEIVTVTNWVVNPTITAGIATASAGNAALNPTPTEPLVNWGLTGLSAALGLLAAWKNKQAGTASALVNTVATAVETYPGPGLDAVKKHIAGVSLALGTADDLHAAVQKATVGVLPAVAKPTA